MIAPPRHDRDDLQRQREFAVDQFRRARMEEPLEDYLEAFEEYQGTVEELLETTLDLTEVESRGVELLSDSSLLEAFRYVAGPPISADDLKTLVSTKGLSRTRLRRDSRLVQRIVETVLIGLDKRRFPWLDEGREASESERAAAVLATAALLATRRVGTKRRMEGKTQQEARVEDSLLAANFTKVPTRAIQTIDDAPGVGEFCRESYLGSRKADFVLRLWDRRVMGIECKVSNSETNSIKRLNNDAAIKAETWRREFGERNVVPAAVLSGVYKMESLEYAQSNGLALFWAHELQRLLDWVDATRR